MSDLRNLVTEGVHKSDTIVVLATKGVLSRPWCLLEIYEAEKKKIPVLFLQMANSGFTLSKAKKFVSDLDNQMKSINPEGIPVLQSSVGDDLTELKQACLRVIEANQNDESFTSGSRRSNDDLVFNPHAGDKVRL